LHKSFAIAIRQAVSPGLPPNRTLPIFGAFSGKATLADDAGITEYAGLPTHFNRQ
jgi:hypothetical protein